jgi:Family of unknown function (DUF6314)
VPAARFHVPDAAAFLAGQWRIARRVRDRRLGESGGLVGKACFTPIPGGLSYEEQGVLRFGTYLGEVTARYRFMESELGAMSVHFADGRLFHRLDFSSGVADVAHDCAPDQYLGRYRALGPDSWTLAWRVSGPRKDMLIGTRYARMIEAVAGN